MNYGGARSEDDFNIGDGFQSWGRVLISPVAFFQETSAFDGIKGPASFVMAFAIVNHVLGIVLGLIAGQGLNFRFGGLFYGWVCQFAFFMICYFIWGGIVHLACKIVGGQSDYSGSFRASTFGSAPCTVMILIAASIMMLGMKNNPSLLGRRLAPVTPYASVREAPASAGLIDGPGAPALHAPLLQISPGAPPGPGGVSGRPDPSQVLSRLWTIFALPMVLVLVGYIWSLALTGIGIAQIHQVGTGAAVGAVLIAVILNIILWIGLFFLLGAAFASMFAALSSTMHR
jgi:hypothetical protein